MKTLARLAGLAVIAVCFSLAAPSLAGHGTGDSAGLTYARVDIDGVGFDALQRLERSEALIWWIEADDRLLVLADRNGLMTLADRWRIEILDVPVEPDRLAFFIEAHETEIGALGPSAIVLVSAGRMAVVQTPVGHPEPPIGGPEETSGGEARILRFVPGTILARQWANSPERPTSLQGAEVLISDLVDQVDADRWLAAVTDLAGFNRHTTQSSEIDDARDWLLARFHELPGLDVTTQSFQIGSTTAYNVIATWTGTSRPDDWYIVGGHYDATSENPSVAAPGAEDNGSGCAGVLEMARVLQTYAPPTTVIYICFSGEEQGLWGSYAHRDWLVSSNNDEKVRMVLNMDMVGYTGDSDLDCLLETHSSFADLLVTFGLAAARYTDLRIVTSTNPFGSDHVPYIQGGIPALLTIENDWSSYPHYHRTTDLPQHLSLDMGREILRMNAAVLADVTGIADGDVIFLDGFESGDTSAWELELEP